MLNTKDKKYTIEDISIFIATHNRADYLQESINSLLNQTAGVREITVLDNESTDNTEEIVRKFADRGVKYIKTTGFLGNFHKAQELADKEYCLIFHDDDLLHPEYLQCVVDLLNKHDNVSLITTRYWTFLNDNIPKIKKESVKDYYLFKSDYELARYMFYTVRACYASCVYKTERLRMFDLDFEKYSKICDGPLMVNVAKEGSSIVINNTNMMLVRQHGGQDTEKCTYCLDIKQCTNWLRFFYDILKSGNDKDNTKILDYLITCYAKGLYPAIDPKIKENLSLKDFIDALNQNGFENIIRSKEMQMKKLKSYRRYCSKIIKTDLITNGSTLGRFREAFNERKENILSIWNKKIVKWQLLSAIRLHNLKCDFRRLINVK